MKRLILMGGRPWPAADGGRAQVEATLRYFSKEVKLAFCIFAQPETDWGDTRQINIDMIERFKGGRDISYQTMTHDNFRDVSNWADIIYIPGGVPAQLKQALEQYEDLADIWDNKVIVGASAGADVLCAHYMYLQTKTIEHGFGWVQATIIPHWRNEDQAVGEQTWGETELLRRYPEMPLLCVPEGECVEVAVK